MIFVAWIITVLVAASVQALIEDPAMSFRCVATTQICFFQDVFSLVKHIRGFLGDAKGRTNWEGVMASQGLCLQMASPTTTLRVST